MNGRIFLLGGLMALVSLTATAQFSVVTLPSASSVVGLAPFFSDVRVLNTSFGSSLEVTATYRCYVGSCPVASPQTTLNFLPREAKALDNIVATTFGMPDTGGAVEFSFAGPEAQLVVTSRLHSTSPTPTVGMFVAGLTASEAHTSTVLTSVRNGGPNGGFRTNVGVYKPNSTSVDVEWDLRDGSQVIGNFVRRTVPPLSGVQVNQIFREAGVESTATQNGVISVTASGPVFSYAAVVDNNTSDPYYVVGAQDLASP